METTKKLDLFNKKKETIKSKLDEFMIRYNNYKKGLKSDFTVNDFDILINFIQSLDNENKLLKDEKNLFLTSYEKDRIVIDKLNNENNKLKKELENLKSKVFIPKKKIQQITEQQIQEIKNLRNQGFSYSKIEQTTKWSKYTISRVLNGHYDK